MRSPDCHRDGQRTHRPGDEWGFTLPELLATVVIIGIIASIAVPSFFGVIEERRVQSATNQLAADLRQAHSRAASELVGVRVVMNAATVGTTTRGYGIGSGAPLRSRSLPSSTTVSPASLAVVFCASGTVFRNSEATCATNGTSSSYINLTVASDDGNPAYRIKVNAQSANVEVCQTSVADNAPCPAT